MLIALATVLSVLVPQVTGPAPSGRVVRALGPTAFVDLDLGGVGHDLELDPVRQVLYVSVPTLNEIVVVSLASFEIVDRIVVGTRPHGIDLSADGTTLYAALHQASAVAYLDLDQRAVVDTVVIGTLLDHSTTWDVIEGRPQRIFVSANPSSGGFAYIVQIDRANGNAAMRVASNRIIRAGPVFARAPDGRFLYVGEGFSPNSLYKLDLDQAAAPIVLEDNHGSVGGTDHLEVSPDGARIYLRSGQVLRTSDFTQIGSIGSGPSRLSPDGSLAYVSRSDGMIQLYDTATFLPAGEVTLPCSPDVFGPGTLLLLPNERGLVALRGGRLCGVLFTALASARIAPASGEVLVTQQFDVALRVNPAGRRIVDLRATLDGVDASALVDLAVIGTTMEGETTYRIPGFKLRTPGVHTFALVAELSDGSLLPVQASWEAVATQEMGSGPRSR
ncbi:MAG TPA: hypothetical protein VF530_07365 [Planctomycetota bacterium]